MSFCKVPLFVIIGLVALPVRPIVNSRLVSRDGTEVGVLDELFTGQHLETITDFFREVSWEFKTNFTESVCADCPRSFQSALPINSFASSLTWKMIKPELKQSDGEVYPLTVRGRILLPGEQTLSQTCSESQKHVVVVFWGKHWGKNSYGEFVVFDKSGEVAVSVRPKFGRTLVLHCPVRFLAHSAANIFGNRLRVLEITSTSSKGLFEEQSLKQKTTFSSRELNYIEKFLHLNAPGNIDTTPTVADHFDLSKSLTQRYTTTKGKQVLVFDGLLSQTYIEKLFEMMHHGVYHDSPAGTDSTDNVQWVLAVETVPFLQTRLWKLVKQVVKHISGRDTFYPYDVSCNHIQSIDLTKFHRDCDKIEDEYTFMIYLNSNWTANHYGETIFLNDDREMLAAVSPKHGRVVIFHGAILHSARPPSPAFQGVRYTFVVKMASPIERAFRKFANNEMEDDEDEETTTLQESRQNYYGAEEKHLNSNQLKDPAFLQELQEMERQLLHALAQM